jgi:hypothetical protein
MNYAPYPVVPHYNPYFHPNFNPYLRAYDPYFDPNFNPYLRAYIQAMTEQCWFIHAPAPPPAAEQSWSIWTFTALDYHLLCGRQRALKAAPPSGCTDEADGILSECFQ